MTNEEKAIFGAGCFWDVELAFRRVTGVKELSTGYSGGTLSNPKYEDFLSGRSDHAEVVMVLYDPSRTTYEKLLEAFWDCHDPTTVDRQGNNIGSEYRSIILTIGDEQWELANASKREQEESGRFQGPIVTKIVRAREFWRAEDYHQHYLSKRGQIEEVAVEELSIGDVLDGQ
jgi:peptide-methionine (S)-S-oxide reductase